MGKFIELHRIPLGGGDASPILLNLDDISQFCSVGSGTIVALRRPPDLVGGTSFRVTESYDEICGLMAECQGLLVAERKGDSRE